MNAFGPVPNPPPFPTRHPSKPALVLPRRARGTEEFGFSRTTSSLDLGDAGRDDLVRHFEAAMQERERALIEAESKMAERTRDLDEWEALLRAREALLDSTREHEPRNRGVVTLREAEALNQLRDELERQEASLREARQALREREKYLEESEAKLLDKVQEQQVKESELEQREENLQHHAARLGERTAAPAIAAPLDEFRE